VSRVPAAATALHYDGVVVRPVAGVEPYPVKLDLAWRRDNDNPALSALISVVREAV
jgi:hypothetical protein